MIRKLLDKLACWWLFRPKRMVHELGLPRYVYGENARRNPTLIGDPYLRAGRWYFIYAKPESVVPINSNEPTQWRNVATSYEWNERSVP